MPSDEISSIDRNERIRLVKEKLEVLTRKLNYLESSSPNKWEAGHVRSAVTELSAELSGLAAGQGEPSPLKMPRGEDGTRWNRFLVGSTKPRRRSLQGSRNPIYQVPRTGPVSSDEYRPYQPRRGPRFQSLKRAGRRFRFRKITAFLAIWVVFFAIGLYELTSINLIMLLWESLLDSLAAFAFLWSISGIARRSTPRRVLAVLVILSLVGIVYQNPAFVSGFGGNSFKQMYTSESDFFSSLGTTVGSSNPGGNSSNPVGQTTTSLPTSVELSNAPYDATDLFSVCANAAACNLNQKFYVGGTVGEVDNQNGNWMSCYQSQLYFSGCNSLTLIGANGQELINSGYWILWNWASQAAASHVPINQHFIAYCAGGGSVDQLHNLNLYDCVIMTCGAPNQYGNLICTYSAQP